MTIEGAQTLRVARDRFEEHHYEARHRMLLLDKPWGKHMATDHQQHGAIKSTDVIFIEAPSTGRGDTDEQKEN